MKRNKDHNTNGHDHGNSRHVVQVEFSHPAATAVGIAGTFNDWIPGATPMVPAGEGRWLKELVLAPGIYEYLLVADGEWLADPHAEATVPNPFGGVNSVITVPADQNDQNGNSKAKRRRQS